MKKSKRIIALLLCLALALGTTGCGGMSSVVSMFSGTTNTVTFDANGSNVENLPAAEDSSDEDRTPSAIEPPADETEAPTLDEHDGFAGGAGTADDPYQVSTPAQLDAVRNDLSAHYVQINDIDMSAFGNFVPIGTMTYTNSVTDDQQRQFEGMDGDPFTGTYDGRGYQITGLTIRENDLDCVGLFAACSESSVIKNVILENATLDIDKIDTDYEQQYNESGWTLQVYAGLISGITYGTISGCQVSGSINVINCHEAVVGGIAGSDGIFEDGALDTCINFAKIDVCSNRENNNQERPVMCGGVLGEGQAITRCINYGDITVFRSGSIEVGGILGCGGNLTYCVNYGDIIATAYSPDYPSRYNYSGFLCTGGIVGQGNGILTCINLGSIEACGYYDAEHQTPNVYAGGIGGEQTSSGYSNKTVGYPSITDCYNGSASIIAINYIASSENRYTDAESKYAHRMLGLPMLCENNCSLSSTLVNGKPVTTETSATDANGETITQEEFDAKLKEVLDIING